MHLIIVVFCYFFFFLKPAAAAAAAAHDIAISCGSTGNYVSPDGRKWVGDVGSQFLFPRRTKITKSCSSSSSSNSFNYLTTTARISTTDFSYTIPVNAGQKFIRLHFSPAPYPGFDSSKCIFTVKAGPYTLLRNFSLDAAAAAAETPLITKEFCLNFDQQQQALTITFSPSVAAAATSSSSASSYAIINGIEIVSVPTGLYHTPDGDDDYQGGGTLVVGQKHHHRFLIDNTTALELIQRVNIGGSTISPTDDGSTLRVWSGDIDYWLEPGISPIITANNITFMNKPPASSSSSSSSYVVVVAAPHRLYQTARFVNHDMLNLTRKVMVDVGFRYLIRLHFCELDEAVRGRGQRQFNIYVNDRIAESKADLFEWTGGSSNLALHRDYVMTMHGDTRRDEGKRKLVVALEPVQTEQVAAAGAILNGLEIFKLSNPDNNLAGHHNSHQPPPLHPTMRISSSKPPPMSLLLLLLYNRGASVSGLIVLMTLLNIVFYKLRLQVDKSGSNTSSSSSSSAKSYRRFSLEEMVVAANNFDEALVIGEGGFGRVYKGVINEKGAIKVAAAIKRLKKSVIMSKQGADEFWTEIETLSKIPRHPHLVNLIGYCDEGDEKILVYEYAVNGTLADHLHSKSSSRTRSAADCLSWERRLNICIGAARGLEYLHNGAPHRIIHRDVKASNILLADNWVPKISDFGFSKAASSTSNSNSNSNETTPEIMGTFGYLDMDYFLTQRLTRKSDVYAFGVLLFEVLCGRPAIDTSFEGEERSLALWAQRCIKEGKLDQIIDPSLTKVTPHSLKAFAEVAFKCLHNRPNARPRMPDVLQRLEFALLLTSQNQHAAGACPSSTDTELEQEEEDEEEDEDYDALLERRSSSSATIIIDNMHTDPITEEEGDDACSTGSSPVSPSLQDGGIMTRAKSQKKTYSKVLDGIAKSMDLRRRKPVPVPKITEAKNSINNSFSSSGGGRTAWWKQRTRSFGIQPRLSSSSLPERPCRHFSLGEMRAATNNFHRNMIIKYGGPGTGAEMYRGYIDNGYLQVAIERLATANNKSKFLQEVELLLLRSQQLYHHRNLVPFIGYCKDEDENEMLLVYQYMARGDLSNHLYGCGTGGNEPVVLPWKKRLEICVGAAQGLDYLHNSNHLENPIIHGDIKSSSILLDEKWVPKISGLKFPGGGEVKSGTPPRPITTSNNYNVLHELPKTKESDVYSFGVVLLEVFCGREALIPHLKYRDQRNLVHWFKSCMQKKEMDRIIDDNLIGKIAPKCLRVFVRTVEWCLQFRAVDRPSMDVVLRRLQDALLLQQGAGEDHHRYTY